MRLKQYITEKKVQLSGDQYKDKFLKQINKWDTDLSKLTKAYKSLKAMFPDNTSYNKEIKNFRTLKKAFTIFTNNFEKYTYQNILDNRNREETWTQNEFRKHAWTFLGDIDVWRLFPTDYDIVTKKDMDALHLLDSNYKGNSRKTNIARYQKSWRKTKEAFKDLIAYDVEKIEEVEKDEIININGVNISIKNRYAKDWSDKYIKKFISHLKNSLKAIRKENLDKAIKDFSIELNFNPSTISGLPNGGGLTAGAYDKNKDKLYIFPLGLSDNLSDSTLIHELGHRYWFRNIPSKAKKAWDDKIFSQTITITKDHIDKFFDRYWDKDRFDGTFMYRDDIKKDLKSIKDPTLKVVLTYLADNRPWFDVEDTENRYDIYKDFMIKNTKGEQVPLEWITDYGRTNPAEAFAETFKLWVANNKGKLGAWTRQFFKDIVRTGGANIKENKSIILDEILRKYGS